MEGIGDRRQQRRDHARVEVDHEDRPAQREDQPALPPLHHRARRRGPFRSSPSYALVRLFGHRPEIARKCRTLKVQSGTPNPTAHSADQRIENAEVMAETETGECGKRAVAIGGRRPIDAEWSQPSLQSPYRERIVAAGQQFKDGISRDKGRITQRREPCQCRRDSRVKGRSSHLYQARAFTGREGAHSRAFEANGQIPSYRQCRCDPSNPR